MAATVVLPGTFATYAAEDVVTFQSLGIDLSFAIESAFYGWFYRDHPAALYDLIAMQWADDERQRDGSVDVYYHAILRLMHRIASHLYGLDTPDHTAIDYIEIVGDYGNLVDPFFVVKLHYQT